MVFEKTLESPLDCKEIQAVNPKGNQSWIFIGRSDAKTETPILWPPDAKNWLIGKDPDPGKDWRKQEKGMIKVEMVGWHHQLNGHEFEQALGVGDGQGSLACCSPWSHKELDTTEQLNWTDESTAGHTPSYRPTTDMTLKYIHESESEVTQSCLTLCNSMDYPTRPVHPWNFQARVLEWVAIPFSRGSSWPRDQTLVSHMAGRCFMVWATREAPSCVCVCVCVCVCIFLSWILWYFKCTVFLYFKISS